MTCNRRAFLKSLAIGCSMATLSPISKLLLAAPTDVLPQKGTPGPVEAQHYEMLSSGEIQCHLCPNSCVRAEGVRSKCRARELRNGKYYSLVYGQPCVLVLDPLEKCPLFHFKSGILGLSIATAGCNLSCQYCQNWQFSQSTPEMTRNFALTPKDVIAKALEYKAGAISFFYTEPTIYFEYMKDIATLAKKAHLPTVMVTGGYINETPLQELFPLIDAFVVGLKGFTEDYYKTVVNGSLEPVKNTIKAIAAAGKHLEIVTLLLPTLNDQMNIIQEEVEWLVKTVGKETPLHFTRFNPQFKLKGLPPTPVVVLDEARKRAMSAGLKFVYTGNLPGHEGNHTFCPGCGKVVIERLGFKILKNLLDHGKCTSCGNSIPGEW